MESWGMLEIQAGTKGSQVTSTMAKISAEEQHCQGDTALLQGTGHSHLAVPSLDTGYCWGTAMVAHCSWHQCHWTFDATTTGMNPNYCLLCVTCSRFRGPAKASDYLSLGHLSISSNQGSQEYVITPLGFCRESRDLPPTKLTQTQKEVQIPNF